MNRKNNQMKNLFLIAGLLLLAFVVYGDSFINIIYQGEYRPVMMKRADLEKSVNYQPGGRPLANPGKIFARPPYLFINERYKGIHIVNNADPKHPVKEAFITAPGCIDMAVKEDILYLDNSVDLVAFDLNARKVTRRLRDVFPQPPAPDNSSFNGYYGPLEEDMVIVEWKKNTRP
jgi:hypothetical protein